MCLDGVRLLTLIAATRAKALNRGHYEPSAVKKLLKVRSRQDLSRRSGLPDGQIDLLAFIKATSYAGLLGSQVFQGLDQDQDGMVELCDFLDALESLSGNNPEKTADFLFAVIDSGLRGFLTPEDVFALFQHLPSTCPTCGHRKYPGLDESIKDAFKGRTCMEFEQFLKCVCEDFHLITHLKTAVLSGFPQVFHAWFTLPSSCCPLPSDSLNTLRPLILNERKFYAEIAYDALLIYNSVSKSHLVTAILLKDVFVENKPENAFSLGNIEFEYEFETDSRDEKEWWVGQLEEITNPENFTFNCQEMEQIGSGAYGKVFKTTDKETGDSVAFKVISKHEITRKLELAVRWEIEGLRCISHPNIMRLYAVHETISEIVLVTEYFPQGTLLEWLQNQGFKLCESHIKSIIIDIANAIRKMHEMGVIHRDLKLENIMMACDDSGIHVKLIDFGLCCFLGPNQMADEGVGTLKYVAPEILARIKYREKVDCWSLGVILYVLLRGTMPFGGKSDEEVALSVLKRRLSFKSEKWVSMSPLVILAVSGLLLRNPSSRLSISDFLHSEWLFSSPTSHNCY